MKHKSQILFSILIPSFNYNEGIRRILTLLSNHDPEIQNFFEVVIFDNSRNDSLSTKIEDFYSRIKNLKYCYNNPANCACDNWNALINSTDVDHFILMHHDEFPFNRNFVLDIIDILKKRPKLDIVLLDCILLNKKKRYLVRHVPVFFRNFFIRKFPSYVLTRNFIGPTGSVIIKRTMFDGFDCRLKWLIDVDAYYRILLNARSIFFAKHVKIVSYTDRLDSITSSMSGNIEKINTKERAILSTKYKTLILLRNTALIKFIEPILWFIFRVVTKGLLIFVNRVGVYPVTYKEAKKIIKNTK